MRAQTGTVKWFNETKGYGFITPEGGDKDVFVHVSDVEKSNLNALAEGDKVEFDLADGKKGVKAVNLSRVA